MSPRQNSATLLTPGPVALSFATKREMLTDHAMDGAFLEGELAFCANILLQIANAGDIGTAIPLSGSATAANEAAIQTFVPPVGKLLIYSNGIFGDRLAAICKAVRVSHRLRQIAPLQPLLASDLSAILASDPTITHVMVVHCETSSGIVNPIAQISDVCQKAGKKLLIDAVSSFGALPIDMTKIRCEALILGTNKCLQGPPGLAWGIVNENSLQGCKGNARSLTLDLWDQWHHLQSFRSFRFTPPTHIIAAFGRALREYLSEGGQPARLARYQRNRNCLINGLTRLGFKPLVDQEVSAPTVVSFVPPTAIASDLVRFSERLAKFGFQISLRRTAVPNTVRIGCMGVLTERHMTDVIHAIGMVLAEMGPMVPSSVDQHRRAG